MFHMLKNAEENMKIIKNKMKDIKRLEWNLQRLKHSIWNKSTPDHCFYFLTIMNNAGKNLGVE
jgi:hypothetical protein